MAYRMIVTEAKAIAVSNCPQDRNPCNGFNPTPLKLQVIEGIHFN
jgi:uncharacterized protein YcgI (DUF1989 family)